MEYSEGREGGLSAVDSELLAAGKMPYGLFAEFVNEQAQFTYVCKNNRIKYGSILGMYKQSIKAYLKERSAVAEAEDDADDEAAAVAVAEGPRDRFR